jgi:hypothetical protein
MDRLNHKSSPLNTMRKKADIEDSKLEIIIPADFKKAHPLVRQARDVLKSRSPDNYNR